MIKIIIAAIVALVIGGALGYQAARMKFVPMLVVKDAQIASLNQQAQSQTPDTANTLMTKEIVNYVFKDGELYRVSNGTLTTATREVTLRDGSTITLRGVWVKPDGSEVRLTDGQSVSEDGVLIEDESSMMEEDTTETETVETTTAPTTAPTSATQ